MSYEQIHPAWNQAPTFVTEGFSVEITAKDVDSLRKAAPGLPPTTPVSLTFLPGESLQERLSAAREIRALGFEPMPHVAARRIENKQEFTTMIETMARQAGVKRCFAIAGDPSAPAGPYADTTALIKTGIFEANGLTAIGIAGHPEGHPVMTEQQCYAVLQAKCELIHQTGMKPLIVTQFGFDPEALMRWLQTVRASGIDAPVRIGIPGPANIKTLLKFAARCGVSASASVLSQYGIALTKLIGTAGPDKLVDAFAAGLSSEHGRARLHFYPFGGLRKTVEWVSDYTASLGHSLFAAPGYALKRPA